VTAEHRTTADGAVRVHIGRDEVVVRRRYEVAGILTDLMIGLWLLVGHALLFSDSLEPWGLSLLLVGSVLMMTRGVIRLARLVHVERIRNRGPGRATASGAAS
jgi:hypothetical protein